MKPVGIGGTWHLDEREVQRGLFRGDRVQVSITHPDGTSERQSGIVVADGGVLTVVDDRFKVAFPEYDNGTDGRDEVVITRVTAAALDDGRL